MHGHSLDLILPMLQFLAIHAGYSLYWVAAMSTVTNVRKKLMTCIAVGGISAVLHNDILGEYYSVLIHAIIAVIFIARHVFNRWHNRCAFVQNPIFDIVVDDVCEQREQREQQIMDDINRLQASGQINESTLEKIYSENKVMIDSNAVLKCQIFTAVLNWRKQKNVKCRAVTINGQRRFLNVDFRSVDWLK